MLMEKEFSLWDQKVKISFKIAIIIYVLRPFFTPSEEWERQLRFPLKIIIIGARIRRIRRRAKGKSQ